MLNHVKQSRQEVGRLLGHSGGKYYRVNNEDGGGTFFLQIFKFQIIIGFTYCPIDGE